MRERRFKTKRLPRKVYLVICEGETEKIYVENLRRHYRLPVTIKTKVSGNSINRRLIDQYINELGIDNDDDYSIFYIYDADVQCVADKLMTLSGEVILTNPCLELWYVLHAVDHKKSNSSDNVLKILNSSHPAWRGYVKGRLTQDQAQLLINNHGLATDRAKKLQWPQNPSSNMWMFLEALEKSKKS